MGRGHSPNEQPAFATQFRSLLPADSQRLGQRLETRERSERSERTPRNCLVRGRAKIISNLAVTQVRARNTSRVEARSGATARLDYRDPSEPEMGTSTGRTLAELT